MLRAAGCLIIVAAGTFLGVSFSDRLKCQTQYLRLMGEMAQSIELYLTSDYLQTQEIIDRLRENPRFNRLDFLHADFSDDIGDSLCESVLSDKSEYLCCIKDRLADYFSRFGKTDLAGQTARTQMLKLEIDEQYRFYRDNYLKHARLYRAMGFLGSLAAAVMLI